MTMTIPNQLTLLRILLIPVFMVVFYLPHEQSNIFACGIFILAAVTDILDGYYARKLNQISPLGVFLDPVADKLMVAVVLVLLVQRNPEIYLAVPAAIIIGRGPSIKKKRHLELLLKSNYKGAIICTDGNLVNLLENGITPKKFPKFYVISVEPYKRIFKMYDNEFDLKSDLRNS